VQSLTRDGAHRAVSVAGDGGVLAGDDGRVEEAVALGGLELSAATGQGSALAHAGTGKGTHSERLARPRTRGWEKLRADTAFSDQSGEIRRKLTR
jgi:hypothetical protein